MLRPARRPTGEASGGPGIKGVRGSSRPMNKEQQSVCPRSRKPGKPRGRCYLLKDQQLREARSPNSEGSQEVRIEIIAAGLPLRAVRAAGNARQGVECKPVSRGKEAGVGRKGPDLEGLQSVAAWIHRADTRGIASPGAGLDGRPGGRLLRDVRAEGLLRAIGRSALLPPAGRFLSVHWRACCLPIDCLRIRAGGRRTPSGRSPGSHPAYPFEPVDPSTRRS
jgi:hypothetical protein